ncbi:N-acetylglucosamine-6-phosphate deacetylase [Agrobacterium sp. NPDC090273]|uniref:N-acetylglucosamine-6-phosphate deacetylase n=1 Tax=Agrobacterium sp. NPDC090273 TaxID=3363919 RepID=UPI00383A8449
MTDILILCDRLYDGISPSFLGNQTIVVRDGQIRSVKATSDEDRLTGNAVRVAVASPGMIDIQINGAADTQFNFSPSPEALATIAWGARQGGTASILPTFITAHGQSYLDAIDAVRKAISSDVPGLIGIHLEGPFLSPARPGIHDPSAIRPLEDEDVFALEQQARDFPGVILLTLAPECQNASHLERLAASGIVLFAGHSEATQADLTKIRGATHLWNAMPAPTSRVSGIVSEVLGGNRLFAGIIADGFHVGEQALTMSVRSAADRLCLVTDAMMTLAGTSSGFNLDSRYISLADGRLTSADGTLAGAHIAMDTSLQTLIKLTGVDAVTALQMATVNPARALGVEERFGRIASGYSANLSLFDEHLNATGVVTQGNLLMRNEAA